MCIICILTLLGDSHISMRLVTLKGIRKPSNLFRIHDRPTLDTETKKDLEKDRKTGRETERQTDRRREYRPSGEYNTARESPPFATSLPFIKAALKRETVPLQTAAGFLKLPGVSGSPKVSSIKNASALPTRGCNKTTTTATLFT